MLDSPLLLLLNDSVLFLGLGLFKAYLSVTDSFSLCTCSLDKRNDKVPPDCRDSRGLTGAESLSGGGEME